jgi:hypothetical protein
MGEDMVGFRKHRLAIVAVACATVIGSGMTSASAGGGGPATVVPPNARVGGRSYSAWSAAQWAWEIAAPNDPTHQVVDPNSGTAASPEPVNCALGQSGNVWFLAGTTYAQSFQTAYRSCTIPHGKNLFFPLIDAWIDNLSCPPNPPTTLTTEELLAQITPFIDAIDPGSLHATVDGRSVAGLTDSSTAFRVQALDFSYTLPANNALGVVACGASLPAGTTTPPPGAVADGVYVMLPPLASGTHQIDFGGSSSGFDEEIHYTITVR